jgi:hypothetical protein
VQLDRFIAVVEGVVDAPCGDERSMHVSRNRNVEPWAVVEALLEGFGGNTLAWSESP